MKTLIFIILKIVEIALIPIAYLGLCYGGYYLNAAICSRSVSEPIRDFGVDFYLGAPLIMLATLASLFLIVVIIWLLITSIPDWIEANKEWSDNIHKRLFKK